MPPHFDWKSVSIKITPVAIMTSNPACRSPKTPAALVMTATIAPPPDAINLARKDPQVRLRDYCEALTFYLGVPSQFIDRILFLENSDSDLSAIQDLATAAAGDKQVEIISFPKGNEYPPKFGKAYGEFRLLDYGLNRSSLLSGSDIIWKVTGRLRLMNIDRLIETAPPNYALYCDLRQIPLGRYLYGNEWIDLRFFSFTLEGYSKFFRDRANSLRDTPNRSAEHYLYKVVEEALPSESIIPRFRVQPAVAGHSGFSNTGYKHWKYRLKNATRSVFRKIAPWLWI